MTRIRENIIWSIKSRFSSCEINQHDLTCGNVFAEHIWRSKTIKENFVKYLFLGEFRRPRQIRMIRCIVFYIHVKFLVTHEYKKQTDGMQICI